jgi:hypothetical protein
MSTLFSHKKKKDESSS